MPQPSIAYAVGRVRAPVNRPLSGEQLERLLAAQDYKEARQMLSEMGWPDAPNMDIQQISVSRLEKTCKLIRDLSSDPQLTNCFLLRHDAQNLKTLLKARILKETPDALSACGTIPIPVLEHAVNEHVYSKLPPPLREAMDDLEKSTALQADPMKIDVRIDQALYLMISERVKEINSPAIREYFTAKADLQNALAFLRVRGASLPGLTFLQMMLPGGRIDAAAWASLQKDPEGLAQKLIPYGKKVRAAADLALHDKNALPALEKAADDFLMTMFRPSRFEPFAIEVLAGYLLALERETAAVRLILSGKLNGFSMDMIRERLREAYA